MTTTKYITHYHNRVEAGTYTEYRIQGPNYRANLPMGTTQEQAQARLDALNATYLKYGNVHTLKARTVTVGDWE